MLEELGLCYELHSVNITKGEQLRPEFPALNVNKKIPILIDHEGKRGDGDGRDSYRRVRRPRSPRDDLCGQVSEGHFT